MKTQTPPSPPGPPLFGNLLQFRRDPLRFLIQTRSNLGDVFRLKLGPENLYVISHPEHIKHVFIDNYKNYEKKSRMWTKLMPLFGFSLVTTDGETWKRRRRLAQPSFHHERISAFAKQMTQTTQELLQRWENNPNSNIDFSSEMMQLTLQILGRTLLNTELTEETQTIQKSIHTILVHANKQGRQLLSIPYSIPTPANRRFLKAVNTLDELVYGIIKSRRENQKSAFDLLSMLMDSRDEETQQGLNDRELRDELVTFIFAGHETSANALTWTFYLLAKHPRIQEQLYLEISKLLQGPPRLKDLKQLSIVERIIKESMRLYPPVWFTGRTLVKDDQIGDFFIPAKSVIMPSIYLTHHHPDIWENPEVFDPDRFLPERIEKMHRQAYIPFGAGPRQCIGNMFALMEMQIIVILLCQHYQFELAPNFEAELEPSITLRPKNGMRLRLIPRAK